MHMVKIIVGIVHSDIQEVCGSRRIVTALVLKFARVRWGTIGFLPNAKHLSAIEKSAFTDILGEAAWSHT